MQKKIIIIFFRVCMIIVLFSIAAIKVNAVTSPVIAVALDGKNFTNYSDFSVGWNEAVGNNNTENTTVKLLTDWTAEVDATYGTSFGTGDGFVDGQIYIPDKLTHRKFITLDLNGYTIDRHLTTADKTGSVIVVGDYWGSTLIIKDTSTDKDGTTHVNGDAVNGKITGGNSGCIGGTYNSNVTIKGGKFTGNRNGYILSFRKFEMVGGEISGNNCDIAVYIDGTNMWYANFGGTAKVCNNSGANVFITEGTISCMTGSNSLREGANICVTVDDIPSEYDSPITDLYGANDYSQYFHSDSSQWFVIDKTYDNEEMIEELENQHYVALKAVTYTVNFNANGHGTAPASLVSVVTGHNISAPIAPSSDGYHFEGWCNEEECIHNWDFSTDTVTSNMVLYAKWSLSDYSIIYKLNGGSNAAINPESYTIESHDISLASPDKQGYKFSGWTYDETEIPQLNVTITKGSIGNRIYTANWMPNIYSVVLEGNGGTGTNLTSYTYGTEITLPTDYIKSGCTFEGWYDDPEFTGRPITVLTPDYTGDITFYAKWTSNHNPDTGDKSNTVFWAFIFIISSCSVAATISVLGKDE